MTPLAMLACEALEMAGHAAHPDRALALKKVAAICGERDVDEQDAIVLFQEEAEKVKRGDIPRQTVFAWAPLRLQQLWYQARPLYGTRRL